ncbi:MAG: Ig-like domain-containing protein, partial [Nitrososphaera sp.]|nr:Ig-like domain-containing protein [Nitrososphaera sp.]
MHHLIGPVIPQSNGRQFTLVGNVVDFGAGNVQQNRKWGITVHGSHYGLVQQNVVYRASGAAYSAEDGSETGNKWYNNFSLYMVGGNGERLEDRDPSDNSKLGRVGISFWINGVGYLSEYVGNIGADGLMCVYCYGGFKFDNVYMPEPLYVPALQGSDPHQGGGSSIDPYSFSWAKFEDNEVYGSSGGITYWWICTKFNTTRAGCSSLIKNLKLWHNSRWNVFAYETSAMTHDGFYAFGDPNISQGFEQSHPIEGADYSQNNNYTIRNFIMHNYRYANGGFTNLGPDDGQVGTVTIENGEFANNGDEWTTCNVGSTNGSNLRKMDFIFRNVTFRKPPTASSSWTSLNFEQGSCGGATILDPTKRVRDILENVTITGVQTGLNATVYPDWQPQHIPSNCSRTPVSTIAGIVCLSGTADTTPPTVSLTAPTNGATVNSTITVSASASDNVGVVGVQFKLDGVNLGTEDTVSPYSVSWNTTTATNASHSLTAVARDAAGNTTTSAAISVTVSNANLNTAARANSYDDVWQSGPTGWVENAKAILGTNNGQVPGMVLWIGDSLTRSTAMGDWAQRGLGKTSEDTAVTNWMNAGLSPQSVDSIDGFALATPYFCSARSYTVGDNLGAWDFMGTSSMPPDTNPITARQKLQDCITYSNALNLTTMLTGLQKPQYAIVEVNLDAGNPGTVPPDLDAMYDLLISKNIVPIIITYTYRENAATFNALVDQYNVALVQYANTNKLPLIDLNNEMLLRLPLAQWPGRFLSDGVHYTTGTAQYPSTSDPYANGGDPAIHATGLALTYNGYGLKGWLGVQKMKEIKALVNDTITPGDTTPPTVSVTAPVSGSTVVDTLTFSATASDNVGVSNVEFFVDGVSKGIDTSSPYSISWDTTNGGTHACIGPHTHSLTAKARDAAGNSTTSSIIIVNMNDPVYCNLSTKFSINDRVQSTGSLNVRSTPAGSLLGTQPVSALGTIVGGPTWANLSGTNYWWWNVNFDSGVDGWAVEDFMELVVPAPTVNFSASPAAITFGQSSTLTWSSTDASSCTASGGWTGTKSISGNQVVTPLATNNYTLTCTGAGGSTIRSVTITVNTASDTTPPSVSISSPITGATVNGTVTVSATASDNIGVVGVQFLLDGANLGAEDVASPYSASWNTTSTSNSSHTLTARARDAAGNTTTSSAVIVTVNNVVADTIPPAVSLTAPLSGSTVLNTTAVSASASDNVGVVGVQFKLDGANLGTEDTVSPYSISWNTATATNASHSLTAVARDAAGNTATSSAITVTVSNITPDTTAPSVPAGL